MRVGTLTYAWEKIGEVPNQAGSALPGLARTVFAFALYVKGPPMHQEKRPGRRDNKRNLKPGGIGFASPAQTLYAFVV